MKTTTTLSRTLLFFCLLGLLSACCRHVVANQKLSRTLKATVMRMIKS
ncbi:MAG: hypothetical protein ACKVK5_16570 [Pseudomonadales bacterium]